jgi:hypothetical protein
MTKSNIGRLFVAAMLLVGSQSPKQTVSVPTQVDSQTTTPGRPTAQNSEQEKQLPIVSDKSDESSQGQENSGNKPDENKSRPPFWVDEVAAYSTLAIAFFTLVTIAVFLYQTKTTRDVERAWVSAAVVKLPERLDWITLPSYGSWTIRYSFKNSGRTPARVESILATFKCVPKLADMPKEPDYGECSSIQEIPAKGWLIVPEDTFPMNITFIGKDGPNKMSQAEIDAIRKGEAALICYGMVKYRDAFNRSHETRFCHVYELTNTQPPYFGWFKMAGHPKYNKTT